MALSGGDVCTAIITGGIGNLPACESIITAQFSIAGLCTVTVIPEALGGGAYPLAPGEIGNLYQPVDPPPGFEDHPAFLVHDDQHDPFTVKQQVRIIIDFRGHKTEREYVVSPRRVNMMVSVANFINTSSRRISVTMKRFRKLLRASVEVLNFRKKR